MSEVPNKVKKKLDKQLSDIANAEAEFEAEKLKYLHLADEINENSFDKKRVKSLEKKQEKATSKIWVVKLQHSKCNLRNSYKIC